MHRLYQHHNENLVSVCIENGVNVRKLCEASKYLHCDEVDAGGGGGVRLRKCRQSVTHRWKLNAFLYSGVRKV